MKPLHGLCKDEEYNIIIDTLAKKKSCNFLVFGLGNDSEMWSALNKGKTVFIEDQESWINKIKEKIPDIDVLHYNYDTKLSDWSRIINNPSRLKMDLPGSITKIKWDIIFVDGPAGNKSIYPGRMKSIYTSSLLCKNDIFIHDYKRIVEKKYSLKYLKKLIRVVGRMAHFRNYIETY